MQYARLILIQKNIITGNNTNQPKIKEKVYKMACILKKEKTMIQPSSLKLIKKGIYTFILNFYLLIKKEKTL